MVTKADIQRAFAKWQRVSIVYNRDCNLRFLGRDREDRKRRRLRRLTVRERDKLILLWRTVIKEGFSPEGAQLW